MVIQLFKEIRALLGRVLKNSKEISMQTGI